MVDGVADNILTLVLDSLNTYRLASLSAYLEQPVLTKVVGRCVGVNFKLKPFNGTLSQFLHTV